MPTVSDKTIGRLSLYRRLLREALADGAKHIYSHELATLAGSTSAQVRRDLMVVGSPGSPNRGYNVLELIDSIANFLELKQQERLALVGIGNLGRALLSYFSLRSGNLSIVASFDIDPAKTGRVMHGCHTYGIAELEDVVRRHGVRVGIICVPADHAQEAADLLLRAGVTGIVNFAPVRLRVPPDVYVEDLDMTMSLEKVAYFARQKAAEREVRQRTEVPGAGAKGGV